jgi:hypothetical protein
MLTLAAPLAEDLFGNEPAALASEEVDVEALSALKRRAAGQMCDVCGKGGAAMACRVCSRQAGCGSACGGGGGRYYHFGCADKAGYVEWHWYDSSYRFALSRMLAYAGVC